MKKRWICLLTVIGILSCGVTAAASSFPDVPDSAAYAEAAEYLSDVGIMQGDTNGNFNPDNYVTRAQMAAIICRMLGETVVSSGSTGFSDVPVSYWANGYIVKATELEIISGYRDGTFRPDNTVTYEQAVKMVIIAAGLSAAAEEQGGYPTGYLLVAEQIDILGNLGLEMGAQLSRANVAMLLFNYFNYNI